MSKNTCPIIPQNGYSVVEPYQEEEKEKGFVQPDTAKDAAMQVKGKVLAVNKNNFVGEYGGIISCPDIKLGDIIIHKTYGSEKITVDDKKYRLVKHPDVIGVIEQ